MSRLLESKICRCHLVIENEIIHDCTPVKWLAPIPGVTEQAGFREAGIHNCQGQLEAYPTFPDTIPYCLCCDHHTVSITQSQKFIGLNKKNFIGLNHSCYSR